MKFVEGNIIAERFRLVRALGSGGMGEVWLAHHTRLDVPCAVKFLRPGTLDAPEARARFEHEARAAAQLRSAHVVQILDHGDDLGVPYIAMELLEGEDLATRLRRVGRLGAKATATIVAQIAKALTRAHAAGLIHRDLKPANVFIVSDVDGELVKVLDFGIAKSTGESAPPSLRGAPSAKGATSATQTGVLMGTPNYMSPEQIAGAAVDARTDLWALALLAFECMTGQLPFSGENLGELFLAIQEAPLPRASALVSDLSPAIDEWFERAAARDPKKRYESARELSEALDAAAGVPRRESEGRAIEMPPQEDRHVSPPIAFDATQPTPVSVGRPLYGASLAPLSTAEQDAPPSSLVSPLAETRFAKTDSKAIGDRDHAPIEGRTNSSRPRLGKLTGAAGLGLLAIAAVIGIAWTRRGATRASTSAAHSSRATPSATALPVSSASAAPTAPVNHGRITQLAAAAEHSCVRFEDGAVSCWGSWAEEPEGERDPVHSRRPSPRALLGVNDAIDIALGGASTCVVRKGGRVSCFGALAALAPVAELADVARIAVREGGVCALSTGGTVRCVGEVGVRHETDGSVPALKGAKQVTLGAEHGCALLSNGNVLCWGSNKSGQLGDEDEKVTSSEEPVKVAGVSGAVEIAGGPTHTCARKADGKVTCWGGTEAFVTHPKVERLNVGAEMWTLYSSAAPARDLSDVTGLAAGDKSTCAIERGGRVRCFGSNELGQLGDGTTTDRWATDKLTPAVDNAVAIAMGSAHACALLASGEIRCWGSNQRAQIGDSAPDRCTGERPCAKRAQVVRGF